MKGIAKAKAQFFYDVQRLRIQTEGRVARAIEFDNADLTEEDKKFFESSASSLRSLEKQALEEADRVVKESPIYPWLRSVKGIGPTMAMVLISQFEIRDTREVINPKTGEVEIRKGAPRPSCFWSFAGLAVRDGHAPRRTRGQVQLSGKKGLTYNSWLRTKLLGVLGPSFLKCGNEEYGTIYRNFKLRLQNRGRCHLSIKEHGRGGTWYPSGSKTDPQPGDFCTEGHIHNQSVRYMVKMFLLDFWREWRTVEGLPVVPPYHEAKLGLKHAHA